MRLRRGRIRLTRRQDADCDTVFQLLIVRRRGGFVLQRL